MPTDSSVGSSPEEGKLSAALFARWQHAWPQIDAKGVLKTTPEDFLVVEQASHDEHAAAEGPHLYLYIEKRGLTSSELVRMVADANGLPRSSIGYAGMKDKFAVTRQWLSVPLEEAPSEVTVPEEVRELARLRATKKLRRGWHEGNDFELVLREIGGAAANNPPTATAIRSALTQRLTQIRDQGVPNYFGPQRFGYDNVPTAIAWLPRRRKERNAFKRGLYLSVLRSFLFNEVLSARIADGSFAQGSFAQGSFAQHDDPLQNAEPATGPLWGRGRLQASAADVEFETAVLADYADICGELEYAGLKQERRALHLQPRDLRWEWQDDATLKLCFGLSGGCYATSLLRELGHFDRPPRPEFSAEAAPQSTPKSTPKSKVLA